MGSACPTHTRLVLGSKHAWCKNPLVLASIADLLNWLSSAMPLTGFLQSVQPNTVKGLAWFPTTSRLLVAAGRLSGPA